MLHKNNTMKKNHLSLIVSTVLLAFSFNANAKENIGSGGIAPAPNELRSVMSVCTPATAQTDLDINNVRATLLTGGDMWWNLVDGKYLVPKPAVGEHGPTSLFAGSLWIGGYDGGGTLKVAAMTYRQSGNDFWPGPLTSSATTDAITCALWDKHFKINRKDASDYYYWVAGGSTGVNPVSASGMDAITNWPSIGPEGQPMAPFWDVNNNTIYEPWLGEVPDFDITGTRGCAAELFGDQSLFWVFNDKGNIHSETGGVAIGIEVQEQAFAFATNDEINNMTFYRYKVINKSSFYLDSTFFGVWVDSDLGSANDDYVGCDVGLGLGYCYNGDLVDDNPPQGQIPYGANPPAIGVDFFEGPFANPNGIDDAASSVPASFLNYGDGSIDNERLGMAKFVYYNNDFTTTGNPNGATNVYQYLTGTWLDASPITYGGTGHLSGGPDCDYMFPGTSDPTGFGTNGISQPPWDEASIGNTPADRRFLQSAGPFKLLAGAKNTITIGVVWARATQGGNLASVALMKGADAKAQKLFDNCFQTLDGPTAPNLAIQELDKELILTWSNPSTTNNANELYTEDPNKASGADSLYRFQGYLIYQLKDNSVSSTDLTNVDKARLVFQCDIADGITQIVNYTPDLSISALVPKEMVNGADKGIVHSIAITEDKFATGNNTLINHKTYYYAMLAYGFSPKPNTSLFNPSILEEYAPYIAGRKNADYPVFTPHAGIPHIPSPEAGGTEAHSSYGGGPKITRIEGQGNGGNVLDFTAETVAAILASSSSRVINPTYENGRGPVNIKVIDPLNIPEGDFTLTIKDTLSPVNAVIDANSIWTLVKSPGGSSNTINSEKTIKIPNEQLINGQPATASAIVPRWGLSVNVVFHRDPGGVSIPNPNGPTPPTVIAYEPKNGFLEGTVSFTDPSKQWIDGFPDQEGDNDFNWIRSGSATVSPYADYSGLDGLDAGQDYEKVLGGTWAPYRLCAQTQTAGGVTSKAGPMWRSAYTTLTLIKNIASVDVVLTADKSKWTRCPVIEMAEDSVEVSLGNTKKHHMRVSQSKDKNGNAAAVGSGTSTNPNDANYNGETGMSWFPGYALNLETGERLNMAFGEDSYLSSANGTDMIWNPTSEIYNPFSYEPVLGGKHYIYVFGHNGDKAYTADPILGTGLKDCPRYDQGKWLHDQFAATAAAATTAASEGYKREIYADAMWVSIPLLRAGHSYYETDVKYRLRVGKSYQKGYTTSAIPVTDLATSPVNSNLPVYTFNTSDIVTHKNDATSAKDALALINIVPNPYYAYSAYEKTTLENTVKVTNLPDQCTVSIYTLNGTLIRQFKKDDTKTSLDWDLKNTARIPVASGLYIIHVDVPNVGEKILKWFGVLRPIDLETY